MRHDDIGCVCATRSRRTSPVGPWRLRARAPGSSTVEIDLVAANGGTTLRFVHRDLPSIEAAETHAAGWDHYLGRLEIAAAGGDPGRDPWLGDDA